MSTPKMIARAATIRMAIAAAERRLLELDCPKERAEELARIQQLRDLLRWTR